MTERSKPSALATGASPFATFVQTIPKLPAVLRRMRPTWHLASLDAVNDAFLRQHGITGLIWDVDGTLTGDRQPELASVAAAAFRALLAVTGLRHVVLSNAGEERFRQLGGMFPAVPILRAYALGDQVLYRRLVGNQDTWTSGDLDRQLAAGARVIRKPNTLLVDYAVRELGCDKDAAVMIGDQYMTDIAGANFAGVRSIKLPTLAQESFRPSVRFSQRLELAIYAVLHGRAEMTG